MLIENEQAGKRCPLLLLVAVENGAYDLVFLLHDGNGSTAPHLAGAEISVLGLAGVCVVGASLLCLEGRVLVVSLGLGALAIAWSDAATFRIPDALSLPAIPLGLLASGSLVYPSSPDLVQVGHVIGMLSGGAGLWLVRVLYRRIRQREGLGFGDVKLSAAGGACVGIDGLGPTLLLACVAAIGAAGAEHWRHRGSVTGSTVLPFGAALAPAIWVVRFEQAV